MINTKLRVLLVFVLVITVSLVGVYYFKNGEYQDQLQANRLLVNSKYEYSQIAGLEYAEVQTLPAISHETLKPGQVFVPILMYHHIRINPMPQDPLWASLNVDPSLLDSE